VDSQILIFVFAIIMFISVMVFGYIPLSLDLSSERMKQLTAIGAGVLIGSAFLVIIPEALETIEFSGGEDNIETSTIGLVILSGFVMMLLLEVIGLPHAVHHDEDKDLLGMSATIGLLVHGAADGLAVGASVSSSTEIGAIVFAAIMIHKGPAAFGFSSFLKHLGLNDTRSKIYLLLFAISSPIVSILTFFILKDTSFATDNNIGLALLFSAGIFIYVSTVDVLPEVHSHDHNHDPPVWFVIIGILLVLFATLLGHEL